jgi:DNA-directed RNA polymerase specialized sigma24 family protein
MKNPKTTNTITINDRKIINSKEQQRALYKMINDNRREAQRTHSCGQSDYRRCCGDCPLCPWYRPGILITLEEERMGNGYDKENTHGKYLPTDITPGPSEVYEQKDTVERILKYAREVCPDGDLILTMRMENLSTYEIAERLEIPQKTAYRHLKKVVEECGKYYLEHFM